MPDHRRSIRLKNYDYSAKGAYFITVCTWNKKCLFGEITSGTMRLSQAGETAAKCWEEIPVHFPQVTPDTFVIMPNHLHGILIIKDVHVGAKNFSPKKGHRPRGTSKTIGSVIRGFKTGVTKWARNNTNIENIWQRNYYEHVIRNEYELDKIREYIVTNPARWERDRENPEVVRLMENKKSINS